MNAKNSPKVPNIFSLSESNTTYGARVVKPKLQEA